MSTNFHACTMKGRVRAKTGLYSTGARGRNLGGNLILRAAPSKHFVEQNKVDIRVQQGQKHGKVSSFLRVSTLALFWTGLTGFTGYNAIL